MARPKKPVPIDQLKFSGEPRFILLQLKAQLAERDTHIEQLENAFIGLDKCASAVWSALEEAEAMAKRFPQYVEDAMKDPHQNAARLREMARYARLFQEAKDNFQRLRP